MSARSLGSGFFFFLMIWSSSLYGQRAGLRFESLTTMDGLSQNSVQAMIQDQQGFLWFGTTDGLNRYDGQKFQIFKVDTHEGLVANDINALYQDRSGVLWFGTHGAGLSRYRDGKMEPYPLSGHEQMVVRDILEDGDGNLWIATLGEGLFRMDKDRVALYQDAPNTLMDGNAFWRLATDLDGNLWVTAANDFFYRYDPESDLLLGYSLPDAGTINDMVFDGKGGLWLGSSNGLWHFPQFDPENPGTPDRYIHDPARNNSIADTTIWDIFEDSLGKLWFGTQGGLSLFDEATQTFINYRASPGDPRGLLSNRVLSIMEDRSGVMWIGTLQGLNKFNARARQMACYVHDLENPDSPKISFAKAILEDSRSRLWLGGYGEGLSRLDQNRKLSRHFSGEGLEPGDLTGNLVFAIVEDAKNRIWVGNENGISLYNEAKQGFQPLTGPGDYQSQITALVAQDPYLWVAGYDGVSRYDTESKTWKWFLYLADNWEGSYPISLYYDEEDMLYVGTTTKGCFRINTLTGEDLQFTNDPNNPTSLSHNRVHSILGHGGKIWVGTHNGLNLLQENGTFRSWQVKDGLPSNVVYAMLADQRGFLWMSTNQGLSRFDPKMETFRNYALQDGLQDWEFNRHSSFAGRNGELFFGGIRGVNAFFPEALNESDYVPPVALTRIAILDQPIRDRDPSEMKQITLEPGENVISFSFAALDYRIPGYNKYACRLEGFHDEWVNLENQGHYTFTNLDPDHYKFRVKAASSDGVWNNEGLTIDLIVRPAWYETLVFRIFLGLALVIIPMLIMLWRLRIARTHNLALQREITRRHAAEESIRQLNSRLEQRVKERTAQLEAAQREMVENAHKAGMSEIASSVLHNVGNVLNSLITSSEMIKEEFDKLPGKNLTMANKKLRQVLEQAHALDQQGEMLLDYYERIMNMFDKRKVVLADNVERIMKKVGIIKAVVIAQQGYATLGAAPEMVSLKNVIDDALKIQEASLQRHRVEVVKNYHETPSVRFHKARLIHIIINLIKNAREAMDENALEDRVLVIDMSMTATHAIVSLSDNGAGIRPDHLPQVFLHGFTTKSFGHGFGLNSCAVAMKEMGGTIRVDSDGLGKGSKFTMEFKLEPVTEPKKPEKTAKVAAK